MPRRRSYRRSRKATSRIGSTGKKVMLGLGAAALGGIIANMIGINKTIPSLALGYLVVVLLVQQLLLQLICYKAVHYQIYSDLRGGSSTPAGTVYS